MVQNILPASSNTQRDDLVKIVTTWETRWQRLRFLRALPLALAIAGLVAAVLIVLLRSRVGLSQINAVLAILACCGIAGGLAMIWYGRARPALEAARHFDRDFDLQERTSTALELLEQRIRTSQQIAEQQITDALVQAHNVDFRHQLTHTPRSRDWVLASLALVMALILALLPAGTGAASVRPITDEAVISAAREDLRDITEEIAASTLLSPEEREALLETLETTLQTLQDPETTAEEAFAALGDAERALSAQSQNLSAETRSQNDSFADALETLREGLGMNTPQEPSSAPEIADFQAMLEQAQSMLESGNSTSNNELSQALEQAAQSWQATNPDIAEALNQAAQNIQQGDTQAGQSTLEDIQNSLEQLQQRQQATEATAQDMEQTAQQAREAAQELAQNEQPSQPGAQEQGGDESDSQGNSGEAEEEGNTGAGGENPGESGDEPGQQGQGGNQNDAQAGNQQGTGEDGQSQSQVPGENTGGAGDSPSTEQFVQGGSAGGGNDNNPDGEGESLYEAIFAPMSLSTSGTSDIVLETDPSEMPVVEGNFQENPEGQSLVPYNRVFRQYAEDAGRALESGYIPLGLRDVVRDYFTSLSPAANEP